VIARYVVVRFGELNRGEHMNVALLAWDEGCVPSSTPIHMRMLKDWKRVRMAFPRPLDFEEDVIKRVTAIKTFADYQEVLRRMGPYTPFEFSDERPSTEPAEKILGGLVEHFLVEPK
jgi:hypothetical protein